MPTLTRRSRASRRGPNPPLRTRRQTPSLEVLEGRRLLAGNVRFAFGLGADPMQVNAVATDAAGNVYITGSFTGNPDLDPGFNQAVLISAGARDIFVAKYSPTGAFLWADQAGSTGDDVGQGLAVDPLGNVIVTGSFTGTVDFDPNPGMAYLTSGPGSAAFVWKLDPNGDLIWARSSSSSGGAAASTTGLAATTDGAGNVYVTGSFQGRAAFGPTTLQAGGSTDAFITKLDASGHFLWADALTGTGNGSGQGTGIGVDAAGNVVTTGQFDGPTDFDPGPGTSVLAPAGGGDLFVSKLDPNGRYVWARAFGGQGTDRAAGLAVDGPGNVYMTGQYAGQVDFLSATISPSATGFGRFVMKLDPAGNLAYARDLGVADAGDPDAGGGLALDAAGNVFVAGVFRGQSNIGGSILTSAGISNLFVARLDPSGRVVSALPSGGAGQVRVNGLAVDGSGRVTVVGGYQGTSQFDTTTLNNRGNQSLFVAGFTLPAPAGPPATQGDYDGDHRADLAVYRPTTGTWYLGQSSAGGRAVQFGGPGDIAVPGDYDGDGKTDIAVYRPSTGQWFIQESTAGPTAISFGGPGDIPVPADYDGDGKTDPAVYRPSTGQWFILQSTAGPRVQSFGGPGDIPVPADYDGDGRADLAVFRPSTAQWFILQSTAGPRAVQLGAANGDQPVPADYDGDGKVDLAVFRPSTCEWFILQSTAGPRHQQFGGPGDMPVPQDDDGDGKIDLGVYRPSTGTWYLSQSSAGPRVQGFGQAGVDVPLTASTSNRISGGGGPITLRSAAAADVPLWVILDPAASGRTAQASTRWGLTATRRPGLAALGQGLGNA